MSLDWKKRYSFRLTEEDTEIGSLLEQVPSNKRSEMIRRMIKFAYQTMVDEKKEKTDLQKLELEMRILKETLEIQHEEIKKMIMNGVTLSTTETKKDEQDVSDQMMKDSANAILSSFGADY